MIRSIKALTASSYISMLFLGVASTLIGAAARNINLSPFEIGVLLTVQNIGFMLAVWIAGALSDNHEKPRILTVGSLILGFSFLTFYLSDIFWVNLIIMLMIGAGAGVYEGVTDAMLLDMHSTRQNLHININHFFVTFGSILITTYLIFLQMSWRVALTQSAVVVLLLAIFFIIARLAIRHTQQEDYAQRLRILSRQRLVVALFIATALVVGVELASSGILTTYLMDMRGFTQVTSKLGLLTFLVGIAAGRLFVGFFTRRSQITQYLLGMFALAGLFFAILYYVDLGVWTYLSIFLAGLSMSALLPLMITLAGLVYPDMSGTVIGTIKVAIPLGGILVPLLMSVVSKWASLQAAIAIFPLALWLACFLLWVTFRRTPALNMPH